MRALHQFWTPKIAKTNQLDLPIGQPLGHKMAGKLPGFI
jgi:hypothetical protein